MFSDFVFKCTKLKDCDMSKYSPSCPSEGNLVLIAKLLCPLQTIFWGCLSFW